MDKSLHLFISGDEKGLLKLTLRLFENGFFNCYLTNQQFNLLSLILHLDVSKREAVWKSFVDGTLSLSFLQTAETSSKEDTQPAEEVKGDEAPESSTPEQSNQDETPETANSGNAEKSENGKGAEFSQNVSIDTELYLKPGKKSVLHLASTVRYLLWEKAVDHLYNGGNDTDLQDTYSLMDESDTEATESKADGVEPSAPRDEEDDYDDEEEEEDSGKDKAVVGETTTKYGNSTEDEDGVITKLEDDKIELVIPISLLTSKPNLPTPIDPASSVDEAIGKMVHPLLGTSSVIESNLERQNETKLIKSFNKIYHGFESDQTNLIKRRKLERSDKQLARGDDLEDGDGSQKGNNVNKLINFGGAANLSLKNLLSKIEDNRDNLNITDIELRNLIMDVRKNRSKWASYNHIGQEELYEACEKVILELRGYTEHSTAFLNKVSKRDAPNYYQIIKKPMDLNTVMKKLKTFQYKTKSEFVDDVMLIWKNCLTYNSDPNHFLRVDALAMQKKALALIPLIPDITVRDRSDVEKEEMLEHAEDTPSTTAVSSPKTTRVAGSKAPKKGRRQGHEHPPLIEDDDDGDDMDVDENPDVTATTSNVDTPDPSVKVENDETPAVETEAEKPDVTVENITTNDNEDDDEDEDDQEGRGDDDDDNQGIEEDDLEMQTWRTLTANSRFKLCSRRSALFKGSKLQPNEEAILRDAQQMSNFSNYLGDENNLVLHRNQYLDDNDEPYLIEYDIGGGVPSIPFKGLSEADLEALDNEAIEKLMRTGQDFNSLPPSRFTSNQSGTTKNILLQNIDLMQDVRKICFKISLIRQMQTQQFLHHTQMQPPDVDRLEDIDLDPVEKLGTHDYMNGEVCYTALKRNVCKVVMANGFESTNEFAADIMTQLAVDYFASLVKSLKMHMESNSINKLPIKGHTKPMTLKQGLLVSLLENGIEKPDALYTYYRENVQKQHTKLIELKERLSSFLKDLLRPGLQEFTEKTFNESSDQFLTGDFSNEIGEDFFGFKELGLDKEFGLLTSTIPLHLLHSRLQSSLNPDQQAHKIKYEDLEDVTYPKLTKESVKKQIGLLQPLLVKVIERSEQNLLKVLRRNDQPEVIPSNNAEVELMEDDELPQKQRNLRPKIPPTGKIMGVRKKPVATSFFLEEDLTKSEVVEV
ncbi:unnamed protein product [Kuraishia capsulata CBS 1993]|uniref:SAGA complex subunit Spt7 n=1 Tax=Kuraishia capsulata CBS 1993 TaxID=1382522 RepID=W6MJX4_9ASCO|nr:uncharacterized protein KUCA_T00002264001 [Kuraishia capsulata CBS 1993]CDK26293.1 unnamed protein product [Kuraishia capsulata CBS 1993]